MDWSPEAVADFGPKPHTRVRQGDPGTKSQEHVLWPVWGWRVLATRREARPLDPFQVLVLRLAQAGVTDLDEMARLGGVGNQLLAGVALGLIARGLLDSYQRVTAKGLEALQADVDERHQVSLGWVFQDGLSGAEFSIFAEELPLVPCDRGDSGWPQLERDGRSVRPFVLGHRADAPAPPTPQRIEQAIARHERLVRRLTRAKQAIAVPMELPPSSLRLADATPWRGHLTTLLCLSDAEDEDFPWYVADPFGFGPSDFLRQSLLEATSVKSVAELLRRLQPESEEAAQRAAAVSQELTAAAELWLCDQLTETGVPGEERVRKALLATARELLRLDHEKSSAGKTRLDEGDVGNALLKLRIAVEVGLSLMREAYPLGEAWRRVTRPTGKRKQTPEDLSNKERMEVIRSYAEAAGFASDAIPPALFGARFGKLQSVAADNSSANVRPLLAGLCLSAPDHERHPMRELAALDPRWLWEVDRIVDQAGGVIHAGRKRFEYEQIEALVERGCKVLHGLLQALQACSKG
jgi:hypothetical protein